MEIMPNILENRDWHIGTWPNPADMFINKVLLGRSHHVLSMAAFTLNAELRSGDRETFWPTKPQIFTIQLFTGEKKSATHSVLQRLKEIYLHIPSAQG